MTTCWHREKRLFFVHVPKCAGTSVGGSVSQHRWHNSWLQSVLPGWCRDGLPNGHQPVWKIPEITGHSVDWFDKIIVIIRDPRAQQYSQWKFWRTRGTEQLHKFGRAHSDDQWALQHGFSEWLQTPRANGPNAMCGDLWRQCGGVFRWWCVLPNGQLPPNLHVLRVEDMATELPKLMIELGADENRLKPIPERNKIGTDWREHDWTPEDRNALFFKFGWSICNYYPAIYDWCHELLQA